MFEWIESNHSCEMSAWSGVSKSAWPWMTSFPFWSFKKAKFVGIVSSWKVGILRQSCLLRSGVSSAKNKTRKVKIARTTVDGTTKKLIWGMKMPVNPHAAGTKEEEYLILGIDTFPVKTLVEAIVSIVALITEMVIKETLRKGMMAMPTEW